MKIGRNLFFLSTLATRQRYPRVNTQKKHVFSPRGTPLLKISRYCAEKGHLSRKDLSSFCSHVIFSRSLSCLLFFLFLTFLPSFRSVLLSPFQITSLKDRHWGLRFCYSGRQFLLMDTSMLHYLGPRKETICLSSLRTKMVTAPLMDIQQT